MRVAIMKGIGHLSYHILHLWVLRQEFILWLVQGLIIIVIMEQFDFEHIGLLTHFERNLCVAYLWPFKHIFIILLQ